MSISKLQRQNRRQSRVRYKLKTINFSIASKMKREAKPRLSVFRSNKHIYVQIIDDVKGVTLVSASSIEKDLRNSVEKLSNKAVEVGKLLGKRATEMGIKEVVYDRGRYKFHGTILNVIKSVQEILEIDKIKNTKETANE